MPGYLSWLVFPVGGCVDGDRDRASGRYAASGALDSAAWRGVHRGQHAGERVVFGLALGQPDVGLGHGPAVPLLEVRPRVQAGQRVPAGPAGAPAMRGTITSKLTSGLPLNLAPRSAAVTSSGVRIQLAAGRSPWPGPGPGQHATAGAGSYWSSSDQ